MYLDRNRIYQIFGGEPIKLRWGGWVSDTYLLQREGWKFHSEEHYEAEMDCYAVRLAVTSPDNHMVISGVTRVLQEQLLEYGFNHQKEIWHHRGLDMQQYNAKDVFRVTSMAEIQSWKALSPVDITMPTMINQQNIYMRDFKIFQPAENQTQEIYIPQDSVDEMFNRILKLQYPQQQEIKKGLIMPEAQPIIQAKIFSLVA
jgi:hypothetical protein